jgi:hypothetical protein
MLHEKLLHFQCLGFQMDVSFESLGAHVDGFPTLSGSDDSPVSYACCSSDAAVCVDFVPESDPVGAALESTGEPPPAALLPPPGTPEFVISHLTRDQLCLLWHMRLGHIHSHHMSKMHQYAIGVPDVPIATELDNCPACAQAKLRKAAASKVSTQRATQCGQGISINFGFLLQSSSTDSSRIGWLKGMYGETCYCLIVDHHSRTLYGEAFQSPSRHPGQLCTF